MISSGAGPVPGIIKVTPHPRSFFSWYLNLLSNIFEIIRFFQLIIIIPNTYYLSFDSLNSTPSTMPSLGTARRPVLLCMRALQWISSVIAMGIFSYLVKKNSHGTHLIYNEVISVLSVVFFLPAFVSPFMPNVLSKYVVPIDLIFSYLWVPPSWCLWSLISMY